MDFSPLIITVKTSVCATLLCFILGLYAARWVHFSTIKFKWLIDGLFTLPLVLPPTVVGFILLLLTGRNGIVGKLLELFHLRLVFSWAGAVLCAVVVSFPLMYKTVRGAFEQIDNNIVYAARTLGLSETYIFWKIIFPVCLPSIGAATVLAFARATGEFGATLMVAGNIPGKTQTISLLIYTAVSSGDMNVALFWVLVIILFAVTSVSCMNIWLQRKSLFTRL